MGLTAFPTILFNSATGSDSAASGAGPATAITGTCAASTNSTTVTFNGTPDLTGVAQDGSHVLWVNGIGFVRISTVNTGAYTCVVETALTISSSTAFAIGGKRATLDATESRRLFAATAAPTASGASGRWIAQLEDDQSLTSTVSLTQTAGTGPLMIQGDSTSSRRTITQTANAAHFTSGAAVRVAFKNLIVRNSNVTKQYFASSGHTGNVFEFTNLVCGDSGGTNCPNGLGTRTSNTVTWILTNVSVLRCGSNGINNFNTLWMKGSEISRCGGAGITGGSASFWIKSSIISHNSGDGINTGPTATGTNVIDECVFDGNTGDGAEFSGANLVGGLIITNTQFTNNGAYGLNVSGTQPHFIDVQHNNFYGNSTAPANGITLDATNLTADPGYTDRTNSVRNYAVGTAMKAAGFPASTATLGAGQSGTTSFLDIGAAQRQEAGGGQRGREQ